MAWWVGLAEGLPVAFLQCHTEMVLSGWVPYLRTRPAPRQVPHGHVFLWGRLGQCTYFGCSVGDKLLMLCFPLYVSLCIFHVFLL